MVLHGSDPNWRTAALARIVLMLAGVKADIEATNVLVSPPEQQTGPYDAELSMLSVLAPEGAAVLLVASNGAAHRASTTPGDDSRRVLR